MKNIFLNKVSNPEYSYIITFLSYEADIDDSIKKLKIKKRDGIQYKVLADLALVSGLGKYRFVEFHSDDRGRIDINTRAFIDPPLAIQNLANRFLAQNPQAISSSFLPTSQKEFLLSVNQMH